MDASASGSREDSAFEATAVDTEGRGTRSLPITEGDGIERLPRGEQIGRYVVLETLGAGAMGTVYAAYDPELDRQVALKLLQGELRNPEAGQVRLRREAQALARLSHPNVVGVHDVGEHEGQVFVAMQYVRGVTLREWAAGDHDWQARLEVMIKAGRGLAAAHAAGLVHRDFKPDNVMIQDTGEVIVLDFGLARAGEDELERVEPALATMQREIQSGGASGSSVLDSELTRTGTILGTPAYMAPEQHTGLAADARCDQFAFAVSAFEVLYGKRPFAGRNMAELLINMSSNVIEYLPPGHPAPAHLHQVILRALSNAPEERWPDMDSLLDALTDQAVGGARRWALYGLLALVPLAVGFSAWKSAPTEQPCTGAAQRVASVWDEARREAVKAALDGTEAPVSKQVLGTLDTYTQSWAETYDQNCRATRVEATQSDRMMDLRASCLERRLDQVRAISELLSDPEADMAGHASEAVSQLRPLAGCSDQQALLAEVEPPPQGQRATVREIQGELERARVLEFAGKYEEARSLGRELVTRAEATAYRPLMGEAHHRLGSILTWTEATSVALPELEEGFHHSLSAGDDTFAAMGAADIAFLYAREEQSTPSREWIRTAESLSERGGKTAETEAWVANIRGVVDDTAGDRESAVVALERAIELWTGLYGEDHVYISAALDNLGGALIELGRLDEAESAHLRAKAMLERIFWSEHPHIGYTEAALGNVYAKRKDWEKAESAYRRAIEILSAAQGGDHRLVASIRLQLIEALIGGGRMDDARKELAADPPLDRLEDDNLRAFAAELRSKLAPTQVAPNDQPNIE